MSTQDLGEREVKSLVNTQYLENLIAKKGLKKSYIAGKLGMSIQTLHRKITNNGDFFTNEVMTLCDVLGITSISDVEKIFFVRDVDRLETR